MQRIPGLEALAVLPLALALALGAAPPAAAEQERKYGETDTVTVAAVDRKARRLVAGVDGRVRVYQVEAVTRILYSDEEIALGRLRAGDRVVIEANDEPDDGRALPVADRIVVVRD